jgi:hypothetical protein
VRGPVPLTIVVDRLGDPPAEAIVSIRRERLALLDISAVVPVGMGDRSQPVPGIVGIRLAAIISEISIAVIGKRILGPLPPSVTPTLRHFRFPATFGQPSHNFHRTFGKHFES